jgi:hypothetical protein
MLRWEMPSGDAFSGKGRTRHDQYSAARKQTLGAMARHIPVGDGIIEMHEC